jgi:asparagine synthase (glutamine-hydrolysing)
MCAILGAFSFGEMPHRIVCNFKKALSLTSHRGPDVSTERVFANAILGFNRLSIVDVNLGSQPLTNENGNVLLVCNGEIYNHRELRKRLKGKHKFSTRSDCEIIAHLYEESSKDFVSKLKGQFAFCLFDLKKQVVILSRDRFGINPLFYAINDENILLVASEIKSLLNLDPSLSKRLDAEGLKETFFLYGPTPPRTCFENINQVTPGHFIIFDLKSTRIVKNRCYWQLPPKLRVCDLNYNKVVNDFGDLFTIAVKRRMQGDIADTAVYLSGGLDSASVLNVLSRQRPFMDINAFSIVFNDERYDESYYQKLVVQTLGANLYQVIGDNSLDQYLIQTIWHIEHPLIRTAPVPLYALSLCVRNHGNKYVLCGEGADELLFGYPVFFANRSSIEDKIMEYSMLDSLFVFNDVTGRDMVDRAAKYIEKKFGGQHDSIRQKQLIEIFTKLSRYLLVSQGDRLSMSHGVEQRFPFLDEDIVDFIFSLPDKWFRNKCVNKALLRSFMRRFLPEKITRRKKQGYSAPMAEQIYGSNILRAVKRNIQDDSFSTLGLYFNKNKVKDLFTKLENRSLSKSEEVSALFVLTTQILHDQYF